jgi:hypothetical protein
MARRNREDTPESTPTTEPTPEATEPTTEAQSEGTPTTEPTSAEGTADSGDQPKTESKPAAEKVDLGPFQAAVAGAVEKRDESTGELPVESFGPVNTAYADLKGAKAKNEARAWLAEQMQDRVNRAPLPADQGGGMELVFEARSFMLIQNQLSAQTAAKAPVDPTEEYISRIVSLALAHQLVTRKVPEGVEENWQERANALAASDEVRNGLTAYLAWADNTAEDKGDAPEVSSVVQAAVKLAAGKAAGKARASRTGGTGAPHEGPNRSVEKHYAEYFADKPIGHEALVATIVNFKSREYGDGRPSSGAVASRLKPKSGKVTLQGIAATTVDGKLGAKKVGETAAVDAA